MQILTATDQTITLVTGSAVSTDYVVSYADHAANAFTPGSSQGNISTATTTTILAAPAASTQRQIKAITITNRHASSSQTIQLFKAVAGSSYALSQNLSLAAGQTAFYNAANGTLAIAPTAQLFVTSGKLLSCQNSITLAGTDGTTMTFPSTSASLARTDAANTFTGTQTFRGSTVVPDGTAAAPGVRLTSEASGFYRFASTSIGVAVGGVMSHRLILGNVAGWGGGIQFAGVSAGDLHVLYSDINTGAINISPGTGNNAGGNIQCYGFSHATKPNYIEFYVSTTLKLTCNGTNWIVNSGRWTIDDTTDATSTTDGSLQTDGGLSVVKKSFLGDDVSLASGKYVKGKHKSDDGTAGYTGTLTLAGLTSITVKDGLITASA